MEPQVESSSPSPEAASPPLGGAASSPPSHPPEKDKERARDRMVGLVIVAASFLLCLALSIWAKEKSQPEMSEPPGPPTVDGVVGYPKQLDGVASLKAARKVTKRPILRGFVLDGVQSDGTIDMTDGASRVRYAFQSSVGQGAQPPREPGTLPKRLTCGKQNVIVRTGGMVAEPDLADYPCPLGELEGLPEPQCDAAELWKLARRRNVPKESKAHIEYYRSKAGPAWRFEIPGTQHRFWMYGDCKRELTLAESHGSVP